MNDNTNQSRRRALKTISLGLASIPVIAITNTAHAAKNDSLRTALKYGDKPVTVNGVVQRCDGCMHWVPGKDAKALGGCKIIPNDTEINPAGHCTAWVAAPKKK
jgi:High potential iron-sulfur protein